MIKSLKASFFVALGVTACISAAVDTTYLFAKDSLDPRIKPNLAAACFVQSSDGYTVAYTNSSLIHNDPNSTVLVMKEKSLKDMFDRCEKTIGENESRDFDSVRWAYWSEFGDETGIGDITIGAEQRDEITGQKLYYPLGNKIVASEAVGGLEEIETYIGSLNTIYQADDLSLSNGERQIKKKIIEKNPDFAQDGWKRWGLDLVL